MKKNAENQENKRKRRGLPWLQTERRGSEMRREFSWENGGTSYKTLEVEQL